MCLLRNSSARPLRIISICVARNSNVSQLYDWNISSKWSGLYFRIGMPLTIDPISLSDKLSIATGSNCPLISFFNALAKVNEFSAEPKIITGLRGALVPQMRLYRYFKINRMLIIVANVNIPIVKIFQMLKYL